MHSSTFWSAVGSVVNAAVVIVLALINWRYLAAANRAATAAEESAAAAQAQAAAAQSQAASARDTLAALERNYRREAEEDKLKIKTGLDIVKRFAVEAVSNIEKGAFLYSLDLQDDSQGFWNEAQRIIRTARRDPPARVGKL
jgi:hypothetical protein